MESNTSNGPICFVYTDDSGNLKIDPHVLDFLHNIKQPSFVASLCGLDHDCKDSILRQLLGSRSSEFYFASTHQSGSKGLRMWDTLLKKTALDGTAYNILLLYDEGIEASDQTEQSATKIFSLAILLSNLFMNNQVCVAKRTKFEQLGGIVMTGPILASITTSFLDALNSGEILSLQGTDFCNAKKPGNDISSERRLPDWTHSIEDKMELLHKQIESSEKIKTEYQKHYEHAINDLNNLSDKYNSRITDLDNKCSTLQGRCSSLLEMLDTEKQESYEWKRKYEEIFAKVREIDSPGKGKMAILKSEDHEAEARIVAANEKAQSAQEELREWIAKYSATADEITAIKNEAALMLERSAEEAKLREAALQAKISEILLAKDKEIKDMAVKLNGAEERLTILCLGLEDMEARMVNFVMESSDFKSQIDEFANRVQVVEGCVQSVEKNPEIVAQEGTLEKKYVSELKRFEETREKCKVSQEEIIIANEFIEAARSQLLTAQNELRSTQILAAERLSLIEIEHRHAAILQRQNDELAAKVERLLASEANATSKVSLLDAMVKQKDKEIESLKQKQEQSVNQTLAESLEVDHAQAIKMPKTPSLEPGTQKEKADIFLLDSEYSSQPAIVAADETPVRAKRTRTEISDASFESSRDAVTDENTVTELKKPKLETPLQKCTFTEIDDSVLQQNEEESETPNASSADYSKYTMKKLRREICGNGFTAELLALKNPKKKDLITLYENLVMKK